MKKSVLVAIAMSAGTAVAQPTIEIFVNGVSGGGFGVTTQGAAVTITVAITGIDFDPFAPLTGLPAPAPTSYQLDINFTGPGRIRDGSASADQVRNIDVDGIFGPQPAASFFTASTFNDGRSISISNSALVFGAIDPAGGLFDDGALFTFVYEQAADQIATDITISTPDPSAASFFGDVLDYGTAGDVPGSVPGGPGVAILGRASIFIPSPATGGAIAVAGLLAARRRR
ncbi:MAG: hypothetical protein AAGI17_06345 [Planctomycetota bacterium]